MASPSVARRARDAEIGQRDNARDREILSAAYSPLRGRIIMPARRACSSLTAPSKKKSKKKREAEGAGAVYK
jgi:hypothetical protein